jgi:hypothetical protein
MSEQAFQNYLLSVVDHGYRTALINGGGFPDVLLIHCNLHSFVEVKDMSIGPSGDRKLHGLFKKTQPPWYAEYLSKGGERLYVVFKVTHSDGAKRYGILHVTMDFVRGLPEAKYSDLFTEYRYLEYPTLKELIDAHFSNPDRVGGSNRHRDERGKGDQ